LTHCTRYCGITEDRGKDERSAQRPPRNKPRGKNPLEDLNLLADLITDVADLFEQGGAVVWLNNGALVPLGKTNLAEIIRTNIVIKCLKEEGPIWKREFLPLEINDRTIATLLLNRKKMAASSAASHNCNTCWPTPHNIATPLRMLQS